MKFIIDRTGDIAKKDKMSYIKTNDREGFEF